MKKNEKEKPIIKLTNKHIAIIVVAVILIGIITTVIVNHCNKVDSMNDLKITYNDGKVMKFSNFEKDFTTEKTITVKNESKENKTFSLEWEGVENSLQKQNNFTYEIKCTGPRCATLGTSQVPVAGFKVFPQVLIEAGKTQTYTVSLKYKGSEKNVSFKGSLKVYSEKVKEETPKKDVKTPEIKENSKKQA